MFDRVTHKCLFSGVNNFGIPKKADKSSGQVVHARDRYPARLPLVHLPFPDRYDRDVQGHCQGHSSGTTNAE